MDQLQALQQIDVKSAFPAPAANFSFFVPSKTPQQRPRVYSAGCTTTSTAATPCPTQLAPGNLEITRVMASRERGASFDSAKGSLPATPDACRKSFQVAMARSELKVSPFKRKASASLNHLERSSRPASPFASEHFPRGKSDQTEVQRLPAPLQTPHSHHIAHILASLRNAKIVESDV